jgi:hypothetical protein
MARDPIRFVRFTVLFALPLSFWTALASAQNTDFDTDFDIDIARIGVGSRFEPFRVSETEPLRDALSAGKLQSDTRVLVMDHPAGRLAFLTDQMAYHHVAQGEMNGEPWMVSF